MRISFKSWLLCEDAFTDVKAELEQRLRYLLPTMLENDPKTFEVGTVPITIHLGFPRPNWMRDIVQSAGFDCRRFSNNVFVYYNPSRMMDQSLIKTVAEHIAREMLGSDSFRTWMKQKDRKANGPEPEPGSEGYKEIIVYRLGGGKGLTNRNAGDATGLWNYLEMVEDSGIARTVGDIITVYRVRVGLPFGPYTRMNVGKADDETTLVGCDNLTGPGKWYSFPDNPKAFQVTPLGNVDEQQFRAAYKAAGQDDEAVARQLGLI